MSQKYIPNMPTKVPNSIIRYIYIALFWVLKALYMEGGISSTTTSGNIQIQAN